LFFFNNIFEIHLHLLTLFHLFMYHFFKFCLFFLSPEKAHYLSMDLLKFLNHIELLKLFFKVKSSPKVIFGLKFPNRLGMAAGFDKNARYVDVLETLGFGSVEIGTVTPRPQFGNPKPRLFRLKKEEAIINRMGFNNEGVEQIIENLKKYSNRKIIIGGNIGKNKDTSNEDAFKDYLECYQKLYPYVDYFTINVSSPNTPNLRALQDKDSLMKIINVLQDFKSNQDVKKPLFLKIAPDLNIDILKDIVAVYQLTNLDALVISNTTIDFDILKLEKEKAKNIGAGGLSGKPIFEKSNQIIREIKYIDDSVRIIGVGGIDSGAKANVKLDLGCELVQIYTGFIYKGPSLIKEIVEEIG